MPEHMEEKLRDWLSTCPYAEYFFNGNTIGITTMQNTDVKYIVEEYDRFYIVSVHLALEKESEKDV